MKQRLKKNLFATMTSKLTHQFKSMNSIKTMRMLIRSKILRNKRVLLLGIKDSTRVAVAIAVTGMQLVALTGAVTEAIAAAAGAIIGATSMKVMKVMKAAIEVSAIEALIEVSAIEALIEDIVAGDSSKTMARILSIVTIVISGSRSRERIKTLKSFKTHPNLSAVAVAITKEGSRPASISDNLVRTTALA